MSDFTPTQMTEAINKIRAPKRMLLDLVFTRSEQSLEETIQYEVKSTTRGLAQFVRPHEPARVIDGDGLVLKTIKVPAIREKSFISAASVVSTAMPGSGNQRQRYEAEIAKRQAKLKSRILRRMEFLAAMALQGGFTITQDNITVAADFEFRSDHKPVLASAAKWNSGSTSVDVIGNIEEFINLISKNSGFTADLMILGQDAAKSFKRDKGVLEALDTKNYSVGSISQLPGSDRIGNFMGLEVYRHNEQYTDGNQSLSMIPANSCIVLATEAPFRKYFGAIADEDAGLQSVEIFSKEWSEKDPSGRWVLAASSPLLVPSDPDAVVFATVQ